MRVFVSHSSHDKTRVEAFAAALRERGIDAWLDRWEIAGGDDVVATINQGLEEADAGLIVFSAAAAASAWVAAETSYLICRCRGELLALARGGGRGERLLRAIVRCRTAWLRTQKHSTVLRWTARGLSA